MTDDMKYYNFMSYADVWHEIDSEGFLITVTSWSNGGHTYWDVNGVVSYDGSLEFEMIYNIVDN
jgi:hypothetical protein